MKIVAVIPTWKGPYPIDQAGAKNVYVTTRDSKSVDVIDNQKLKRIRTIRLTHFPRSMGYNAAKKLAVVSGKKKALSTVINTRSHQVVGRVGTDCETKRWWMGFGGSLATGHPFWVTDDKFLHIDRAHRKIDLYKVSGSHNRYRIYKLDSMKVATSVHHVIRVPNAKGRDKNRFYGIAEGAPLHGKSPAIIAFELSGNKLKHKRTVHTPTKDATKTGSHHASFHPDGKHIYLGSNEGYTYVINRLRMKVVTTIKTGKGNGHTTFIPGRMIGVSTNHDDRFMTIINAKTHKKITDIYVSNKLSADKSRKTQSHTTSFDPKNDRYVYSAASNEGRIFEIDLQTCKVKRTIQLKKGSYPIQGTFVWGTGSKDAVM